MHSPTSEAQFWDRAARKYAGMRISDMAGYERTLERTLELLNPGDRVLEIGCGTGTTALRIAPHVQQMIASDISGTMIEIAREKALAQDCKNIDFHVAGAAAVLAAYATIDAALAFSVLHLLRNRPAAYSTILRALKPGGLFISKTPCLSEMNVLIRLAVPVMKLIGKAPPVDFFRGEQLESEIAASGFEIVETGRHGSGRRDARIFIVARKPR